MRRIGFAACCLLGVGLTWAAGQAAASTAAPARTANVTVALSGTQRSHTASADAGYAVYGKHFSVVETWVTLPRASRFAREAGRIGASVQLWTAREVIDLRVSACTDATCRPGGRSGCHSYHAVLDVYNRRTHALICSTTAGGPRRCPAPIGSFSRTPIASGHNIGLSLVYPVPYDSVEVTAGNLGYTYWVPSSNTGKPLLNFTQARITAEFGSSPWARPGLDPPAARIAVMSFDRPTPPPYAAEIGTIAGKAAGIAAPWWGHHKMATSPYRATAGKLWDDGYGLSVYLTR